MSDQEAAAADITIMLISLAIMLVPAIFFLLTWSKAFRRCGSHAQLSPNLVWLNFVPLLNIVWPWICVFKFSSSVKAATGDSNSGAFGVGLAMLICSLVSGLFPPAALAALILWIVYWEKWPKPERSPKKPTVATSKPNNKGRATSTSPKSAKAPAILNRRRFFHVIPRRSETKTTSHN
jgi:lysylphosphatidylglycerol synthetase-like protein (DUF2156 family)